MLWPFSAVCILVGCIYALDWATATHQSRLKENDYTRTYFIYNTT